MIKPTIGRVVWYQPPAPSGQPLRDQPYPALIAFVHSDTCINVGYFDQNGVAGSACSVKLLAEGEDRPLSGYFAEWMPYQVGQAKKHEQPTPIETKTYADGTKATGPAPLPDMSPNGAPALQPHQQRVVDEKCELDSRLAKLTPFFDTPTFASLAEEEKQRLERQEEAMKVYSAILTERIAAFQATASTTV